MRRIIFEWPSGAPTTTLQFSSGLELQPPTWNIGIGTVVKEAFDGTTYAYEKGVSKETILLKIDLLTEIERDDLIDFIFNTVEGSYRVFSYTDQDNNVRDVRFLNEEYDFGDGTFPWSVSLLLLVED